MSEAKNLAAALLAAQKAVSPFVRNAENTYHHYPYTTTEAKIGHCRGILHEHGLALSVAGGEIRNDDGQFILVNQYRLDHSESGEAELYRWQWPIVPEKGRPLDKATAAADTSSYGYFLRKLLMIPQVDPGDEMDGDQRDRDNQKGEGAGGPATGAGSLRSQSAVPREPVPSLEDIKAIKTLITSNLQGIAETFPDKYADMAGTECRSLLEGKKALTGPSAWSKESLDKLRSWLKAEYEKRQPKAGAGKEDDNTGENGGVDQGSGGADLPPGESSKAPADDYPEGAALVVALKDKLAKMLTYAEPGSVTEQTCDEIKSALTTYGNTKSGKALREKAIRGHWLD